RRAIHVSISLGNSHTNHMSNTLKSSSLGKSSRRRARRPGSLTPITARRMISKVMSCIRGRMANGLPVGHVATSASVISTTRFLFSDHRLGVWPPCQTLLRLRSLNQSVRMYNTYVRLPVKLECIHGPDKSPRTAARGGDRMPTHQGLCPYDRA